MSEIVTSDTPTGGLAVVGGVVFVGLGRFGGATEAVVRIDGMGETVIADGFNSLAGFAYDEVNDRLLVGDNGLEAGGSETGDTIYAIAGPFDPVITPQRAVDVELLSAGSIPDAADLTVDPGDSLGQTVFVSNASLPSGQTLRVDLSSPSPSEVVQSFAGFSAGIAATPDELFIGEIEFATFDGVILVADLPGGSGPTDTLIGGMDGQFDLVVASDGTLLATASVFGGPSAILRIDPATGAIIETVASGFEFATVLAEEAGEIYAVEGSGSAPNRILVFTPIPEPSQLALLLSGLSGLVVLDRVRAARVPRGSALRRSSNDFRMSRTSFRDPRWSCRAEPHLAPTTSAASLGLSLAMLP